MLLVHRKAICLYDSKVQMWIVLVSFPHFMHMFFSQILQYSFMQDYPQIIKRLFTFLSQIP